MSSRTWQKRIQDILQSISGIQQRTLGNPTVPWRVMGDMRNIITHEYFQLDIERMSEK
jgi:uncharacterized protein with HEPN domain